ncbi:MAG: hypothetical protein WAM84_02010 [Candidatus Cybelea sp.]
MLDDLGRIDQTRPRPAEVGVSVKGQDSTGTLRRKRPPSRDRAELGDGVARFGKIETARCDDDCLGAGLRDRGPLQPLRVRTGVG